MTKILVLLKRYTDNISLTVSQHQNFYQGVLISNLKNMVAPAITQCETTDSGRRTCYTKSTDALMNRPMREREI